ncbi:hypothetical protein BH10PAT1_BH10PAT1_6750 [soil metagenome]
MDQLIFLYLSIFPAGKILGNLSDFIIIFISIIFIFENKKFKLNNFSIVCIFSLIFSLIFFKITELNIGILYLIRFLSYLIFSEVIYERFGKNKKDINYIFNKLIIVGIFIAIFGWIQYFLLPDLRFLRNFGWDDHYFRLVSTFLDPAFTGIILVLTEILIIVKTLKNKTKLNYLLNIFLILTILFTYSRSSYLALFFAIIFLFIKFREKFLLGILILFILLIPFLPKEPSEGTNLARTYSINQKFINYQESITLIEKSPVFGIGFDNLCIAKNKFLNSDNPKSHTCSGLDNSILFIVATTGIVGLIIFIQFIYKIIINTKLDLIGWGLMASFIAIFTHGMFTETFFYNFILGWLAILVGITRSKD